ncbi:uncharacterized protein LOC121370286 isoform X2 [Gigantopelta aegis]|nr:uncharacterized protein LOC121370286 isoform X2 [Gigantopelta aegis]XP_041351358.1 uncharacterized protein LOC121370286 isoform X2 [Gigantopelta aegis]
MEFYVHRKDQEEEFFKNFKDYKIIGLSACPGMGKSCFMDFIYTAAEKEYGDMVFIKVDVSMITSKKNLFDCLIDIICQKAKVEREHVPCYNNNDLAELVQVFSKSCISHICIYFDNIRRPSEEGKKCSPESNIQNESQRSQTYSAKDDIQNTIIKLLKPGATNNQNVKIQFKFMYTSEMVLLFAFMRKQFFSRVLRSLTVAEAREIFDEYDLTAEDVPDEIVKCLNDRDVANGNPTVLVMIASELMNNRGLMDSVEFKQLMFTVGMRQEITNPENYAPDERISDKNRSFLDTLPEELRKEAYKITKFGPAVTAESIAVAEGTTIAAKKYFIIRLLRNHVLQKVDNGFGIPALMQDDLKDSTGTDDDDRSAGVAQNNINAYHGKADWTKPDTTTGRTGNHGDGCDKSNLTMNDILENLNCANGDCDSTQRCIATNTVRNHDDYRLVKHTKRPADRDDQFKQEMEFLDEVRKETFQRSHSTEFSVQYYNDRQNEHYDMSYSSGPIHSIEDNTYWPERENLPKEDLNTKEVKEINHQIHKHGSRQHMTSNYNTPRNAIEHESSAEGHPGLVISSAGINPFNFVDHCGRNKPNTINCQTKKFRGEEVNAEDLELEKSIPKNSLVGCTGNDMPAQLVQQSPHHDTPVQLTQHNTPLDAPVTKFLREDEESDCHSARSGCFHANVSHMDRHSFTNGGEVCNEHLQNDCPNTPEYMQRTSYPSALYASFDVTQQTCRKQLEE